MSFKNGIQGGRRYSYGPMGVSSVSPVVGALECTARIVCLTMCVCDMFPRTCGQGLVKGGLEVSDEVRRSGESGGAGQGDSLLL
jgi:hypothetical protein